MARIVLITGANRGIGRELGAQLAAGGDTVLLTARDEQKAIQAASEIGGDVHPIQLDASDRRPSTPRRRRSPRNTATSTCLSTTSAACSAMTSSPPP